MNSRTVIFALTLIFVMSIGLAIVPTFTRISPLANAAASSISTSTSQFSLWFPNGTAYSLYQNNLPLVLGAQDLDINGIPVNLQVGEGAPPEGYDAGVVVLRNDGNMPITVNGTLQSVNVPSNVTLAFDCYSVNPSLYGSELDGWMGYGSLASLSTDPAFISNVTINPSQYIWLGLTVTMAGVVDAQNPSGSLLAVTQPFSYSFNVLITANSTSQTSQQTIQVNNNYPTPIMPFTDNFASFFSTNFYDGWTIVDGNWTSVSDGVQGTGSGEALMFAASAWGTNYQVTAPVTISAGGEATIVFRYSDSSDFYWAGLGSWGSQYAISKVVGGVYSEIKGSGSSTANHAGTYTLQVDAQGSTLSLYVDGVLELSTADSTFASGAIGLRTFDAAMVVGSIEVSALTNPTPTTSPTPTMTPISTTTPISTINPTPSPTPKPTSTPTTTAPTTEPAATPTTAPAPTSTAAPTSASTSAPQPTTTSTLPTAVPNPAATAGSTVVISYSTVEEQKMLNGQTYDVAQAGCVFAVVNVTIQNDGYDSFSTDTGWFNIVANNVAYTPDVAYTNNWTNINLQNKGTLTGTLVFQIPAGTTVTALKYNGVTGSLQNYNIDYINNTRTTVVTPEIPNMETLTFMALIVIGETVSIIIYKKTKHQE